MKNTDNSVYDVIIIGGGPSGMMAGISAKIHHPQFRVLILDRSIELGRKLLVSGAGRANLTNVNLINRPERSFNNNNFVTGIFSQFDYSQIYKFFTDLGIPLYEESKTGRGKIFPTINSAKTIREILIDKLFELGVVFELNQDISKTEFVNDHWEINSGNRKYQTVYLILSAGGKTYPSLGSDGSGYVLAQTIGHKIIDPVPSAVPLVSKNLLSHYLQGESVKMRVTSMISGRVKDAAVGEVMFTQFGISGPAVFDVSRNISIRLNREKRNDVKVALSFLPEYSNDEIRQQLHQRLLMHPTLLASHVLYGLMTIKSAGAVCAVSGIPKERIVQDITEKEKEKLLSTLTSYEIDIIQTRGWNEAEFTSGGVDFLEIDSNSLASKICPNLFFSGEIIDVDGIVGGYNLSWGWASGWVAGKLGTKE
jgi:predicted Rossmann fold flavoprotein